MPYRISSVEMGLSAKAVAYFFRAITIAPERPTAFNGRADAYEALGEPDRAAADRQEAELLGSKEPASRKIRLRETMEVRYGRRIQRTARSRPTHKVQERSKKWYGDYKDANGITRRVPLKTDKAASQAKLNELVRNEERRSAGLFDPYEEHRRRPLTEHIDEYEAFLNSKGNSEQYVGQTIARIRKLATACKFRSLPDIDAPKIANWLARRRKKSARFSAQTSNFYLDCFKYFCNWLVTYDRIPKNPVSMLQRVNVDTDRRHDRRPLTDEEFVRLVEAARNGRRAEGVQGKDRAMLYILAA